MALENGSIVLPDPLDAPGILPRGHRTRERGVRSCLHNEWNENDSSSAAGNGSRKSLAKPVAWDREPSEKARIHRTHESVRRDLWFPACRRRTVERSTITGSPVQSASGKPEQSIEPGSSCAQAA